MKRMLRGGLKYQRAILAFMAALLVFLGVLDTAVFFELERILLRNGRQQAARELALMGNFTREALLRNDYVTAQQYLSQWAEEHADIVRFRAVAPNGFVLVTHERPRPANHLFNFEHEVEYAGRPLVSLRMTRDFADLIKSLRALKWQMVLRSLLLTGLLGIALWHALRRLAIAPLEREIANRLQNEKTIKRGYLFQSALNEMLKVSLEPLSLEQHLERVLDLLLAVPSLTMEAKGCIYLVEDDPQTLVMKVHRGFDPAVLESCARVPFGKCLCGKAASRSEVVFADCLTEIHEIRWPGIFPHGHYCVPITSGERFYGLINLVLKESHVREREEEQFLSSVANTLAGVIERYRTMAEKEKLQGRLIESEKLSALGRMTTNVAHEIRNPLTVVGGIARRLDRRFPEEAAEKKYTGVIASEVRRLEMILKRLDSFIFDLSLEKYTINFNRLVEEAIAGFREICAQRGIEIRTSFAELPKVEMDRRKAREALDNVIDNALDAMPSGGILTVQTRREQRENRDYAVVRVADTGLGIEPQNLDLIFEPFYTTKAVGQRHAVGLGLSITRKYMDRHNGFVEVTSRPGAGSAFDLCFPL